MFLPVFDVSSIRPKVVSGNFGATSAMAGA